MPIHMRANEARILAQIAHAGQKYGEKDFYEAHVSEVAKRVDIATRHIYGQDHITVAYLHDIVEDTAVTLNHLIAFGFHPKVVKAVEALTRRNGEQYFDYIERVKASGGIARLVKYHDLQANMNDNTKPSLMKRNKKALLILMNDPPFFGNG